MAIPRRRGGRTVPGARRRGTGRHRAVGVAAALAILTLTAACSSGSTSPAGSGVSSTGNPDTQLAIPGPYAAGTARFVMPDGDGVQVWYPVDRSATAGKSTYTYQLRSWVPASLTENKLLASLPDSVPTTAYLNLPAATDAAASGDPSHRFPVVLFSHGFGSYPEQSSFLTDHLATWGFVVAAPDHRSRDLAAVLTGTVAAHVGTPSTTAPDVEDLRTALAFLRAQDAEAGSLLYHRLDFTRIGVVGHSAGGGAAITLAGDSDIRTYVALAPAPGVPPTTSKPGLVMFGSADAIVPPSSVRSTFASLPSPKREIVIDGAGHNVFDDICEIHTGSQRLVDILHKLPSSAGPVGAFSTLATDGCFPPDVSPPLAWPLIDQATTAQLRYGLGIDTGPVGLGNGLDHAFRGVTAAVTSVG